MSFKKVSQPRESSEPVAALLEVLPGHDEQVLVEWLRQQGATKVASLAPGFLSVDATRETLRQAESMARVEIKHPKTMRG